MSATKSTKASNKSVKDRAQVLLDISTKPPPGHQATTTKAAVSPEKPSKCGVGRYFIYEMKDGTYTQITGVRNAAEYESEYELLIQEKQRFRTKTARTEYLKQRPSTHRNVPQTSGSTTEEVSNCKKRAHALLGMVQNDNLDSCNRIEASWKTTSNSTLAVIVWRLKTQFPDDYDYWGFKPDWMLDFVAKHQYDEVAEGKPLLKEFLNSLSHGYASDPTKADKTVKKIISYEDKRKKERSYEEIHPYGFITIPVESFISKEQEEEWITLRTHDMVAALLEILKGEVFKIMCEEFKSRKNFTRIIFNPKQKNNYPDYIESCVTSVKKLDNLTQEFIQPEANRIIDILYQHRLPKPKYQSVVVDKNDSGVSSEEEG